MKVICQQKALSGPLGFCVILVIVRDSNLFSKYFFCFLDIDECTLNTDNCDVDTRATCTNVPGSFSCACNVGYSGDGISCVGP